MLTTRLPHFSPIRPLSRPQPVPSPLGQFPGQEEGRAGTEERPGNRGQHALLRGHRGHFEVRRTYRVTQKFLHIFVLPRWFEAVSSSGHVRGASMDGKVKAVNSLIKDGGSTNAVRINAQETHQSGKFKFDLFQVIPAPISPPPPSSSFEAVR